eukprot:TRINITY_DN1498_c0_g1_i1.p1 TRINITY_DN1498_c0_g1~~TRINITY_DN1498_c0_g1_i1.p1  ORF type:complete len:879 (+),score=190.50 TRINITY_DN1498_c0_g1_i1:60-2639(+)
MALKQRTEPSSSPSDWPTRPGTSFSHGQDRASSSAATDWPSRPGSTAIGGRESSPPLVLPGTPRSARPWSAGRDAKPGDGGYGDLAGPAPARPLRLENASAELIEQLRLLSGEEPPRSRPTSARNRPPKLADQLVCRANERVLEFTCKYAGEKRALAKTKGDGLPQSQDRDAWHHEQQAHFNELMTGIEQALNGGAAEQVESRPSIIFRAGTVVEESLEANSVFFLTMPLPRRKVEVVLNIARLTGGMPSLFASDTETRPSSRSYDIDAEGGEITYRHDPDVGARTALYLCVESGEQACNFRLRGALRRFDAEAGDGQTESQNAASCRNRIEQKLATLRADALLRQSFEGRLIEAKRHMNRLRGNTNFAVKNKQVMTEIAGMGSTARKQREAIKQRARLPLVEARREEVELAREERMNWWVEKDEIRRLEREEEARLEEEAMMMQKRRADLLEKLLTVSFGIHLFNTARKTKVARDLEMKVLMAVRKIEVWCLRYLGKLKRKKLYHNMVSLRLAVVVFARSLQPPKKAMAQERLNWFLPKFLTHKSKPSLTDLIKRFTNAVRHLDLLQVTAELLKADAGSKDLEQAAAQPKGKAKAKAKAAALPPSPPSSPVNGSKKGAKGGKANAAKVSGQKEKEKEAEKAEEKEKPPNQGPRKRNAIRQIESLPIAGAPDWVKAYTGEEELLPYFIRKQVIRRHVFWMHSTYRSRMAAYEKSKDELSAEIDLKKLGLGDTEEKLKAIENIPKIIEIARMPDLYQQTYNRYINDGFRELIHSRQRLLKKVFKPWYRFLSGMVVEKNEPDIARDFKTALHRSIVSVAPLIEDWEGSGSGHSSLKQPAGSGRGRGRPSLALGKRRTSTSS